MSSASLLVVALGIAGVIVVAWYFRLFSR